MIWTVKALFAFAMFTLGIVPGAHAAAGNGEVPVETATVPAQPHRVYLIPGQGADGRLFSRLDLQGYDTVVLEFLVPEKKETLQHYALRMAGRIDTTRPFSLVGVSFGGMIAVEISRVLEPERVIIVSSAACRDELPVRYRVMKYLPLYRLFPGGLLKRLALVAQPLFEPASKAQRDIFRAMIRDKDPRFMQRSIYCIVHWSLERAPGGVIHIHGTKDHTLPIRRVSDPVVVEGGSHMMILVRGPELSPLIRSFLPQPFSSAGAPVDGGPGEP